MGRYPHFLRAAIVGALAGLLAVAFQWLMTLGEHERNHLLESLRDIPGGEYWGWAVLPAAGMLLGCAIGWAVVKWAPDAAGSGIPHIKGVLVGLRDLKWKALLPVKFFGGVLGVGAGMSLGREGPTVQMGAAVGRVVADVTHLPPRAVPQLISCGAGAGVSAAFNAPLAGFLFVLEELHREMSTLTFGGALIAAVVADIVARSLTGGLPSFAVHEFPALPLSALPAVVVLGVVGGLIGVGFNKSLLWAGRKAAGGAGVLARFPRWALPGIALAVCGLAAWWLPDAAGGGHSVAERLMSPAMNMPVVVLLVLLAVKFGLTVISYASGAPGGIFAPLLLLGVVMGAIVGKTTELLFPALGPHTAAFGVLGMAALFTGSIRAPLTGMVLILEMTANYEQLLALSVACLGAYLTAELTGDRPIYEALLAADLKRRGVAGHDDAQPRSVVVGIQHGSPLAGKAIREGHWPEGCLVVTVERAGREVLPTASLVLSPGDHITVLVPADHPERSLAVVKMCTQGLYAEPERTGGEAAAEQPGPAAAPAPPPGQG